MQHSSINLPLLFQFYNLSQSKLNNIFTFLLTTSLLTKVNNIFTILQLLFMTISPLMIFICYSWPHRLYPHLPFSKLLSSNYRIYISTTYTITTTTVPKKNSYCLTSFMRPHLSINSNQTYITIKLIDHNHKTTWPQVLSSSTIFRYIYFQYNIKIKNIYSLCFIIDDVLKSYWCFKIHDVWYFLISLKFIENWVTNNVL